MLFDLKVRKPSIYIYIYIYIYIIISNLYFIGIVSQVRRLAIIIKYNYELKKLFLEGIERAKRDKEIPLENNKTYIPIGKLYNL